MAETNLEHGPFNTLGTKSCALKPIADKCEEDSEHHKAEDDFGAGGEFADYSSGMNVAVSEAGKGNYAKVKVVEPMRDWLD